MILDIIQIGLLLVLIALGLYKDKQQREIRRRLNNLLDDHGEVPVEIPEPDFVGGPRAVFDGLRRRAVARKRP